MVFMFSQHIVQIRNTDWIRNNQFKNFFVYVDEGVPIVQQKSFDLDTTKVILDIPYDTLVMLYSESESSICSTIQSEIDLRNIMYDAENMGFIDTFKSGVSELIDCFEG